MCILLRTGEKNGYGARDIDRKVQKLYNTYIGRTACGQVLKGGTPLLKKSDRLLQQAGSSAESVHTIGKI